MLYTVLIVVLILLVLGGLPNWGYHAYGWAPSGVLGFILIIFVIVFLFGKR